MGFKSRSETAKTDPTDLSATMSSGPRREVIPEILKRKKSSISLHPKELLCPQDEEPLALAVRGAATTTTPASAAHSGFELEHAT